MEKLANNSDVNKDLGFKAKALGFKAKTKAKDLSFKAKALSFKAKDLTFYQGQGQIIWSLRTSNFKDKDLNI